MMHMLGYGLKMNGVPMVAGYTPIAMIMPGGMIPAEIAWPALTETASAARRHLWRRAAKHHWDVLRHNEPTGPGQVWETRGRDSGAALQLYGHLNTYEVRWDPTETRLLYVLTIVPRGDTLCVPLGAQRMQQVEQRLQTEGRTLLNLIWTLLDAWLAEKAHGES